MYRYVFPLTLAVCLSQTANAQPPGSFAGDAAPAVPMQSTGIVEPSVALTLEVALRLALNANRDLSAARHELQAVEATVLQADMLPNPSLGLEVEDTRRDTRETTIQISQPIELGGKRAVRIRAAESSRDAAAADLKTRQAEVRAMVITAFFNVLAAQERLRLAQDSAELAQGATNVASRQVAAGKVSPVEETRARVAQTGVRLELLQAKSELTSARRQLGATWGNPAPRFTEADGNLDVLPAMPDTATLAARLTEAPALSRARLEVDRREAVAQVERSRRIPDLTVSLGIKRNAELGRNQAIVGVALPLPVFDQNRGNMLESLRRVDKARDELSATEVRLNSELAQAAQNLDTSREEVDSLRNEVLPGAQSAYDAATKGFEFGKFGFLDVLDAQRTLLQAKSQYLRALSQAHRAAAEIDRILGAPPHALIK
jgi:cobalt-zinc-cadmium efflux system outer membrane protein